MTPPQSAAVRPKHLAPPCRPPRGSLRTRRRARGARASPAAARPAAHCELPRFRHPGDRRPGSTGDRPADHHRSARARAGDRPIERADEPRCVLPAVPVDARGARLRRARVRRRDSDRARRECADGPGGGLRHPGDRAREYRRRAARAGVAAAAAAGGASRGAPTVERADRRGPAAELAPDHRPDPQDGSGRHARRRGHRASRMRRPTRSCGC